MSVDITSVPPWKRELLERKRRQEVDEKKRQPGDMDKSEDTSSDIPAWKRGILMKKQQQRNSMIFLSKSGSTSNMRAERPKSEPPRSLALRKSSSTSAVMASEPMEVYERPVSPGVSVTMHHLPLPDEALRPTGEFDLNAIEGEAGPNKEHLVPIVQNPWLKSDPVIQTKRHLRSPVAQKTRQVEGESSSSQSALVATHSCDNTDGTRHTRKENDNNEEDVFSSETDIAYGRGFVHKLLKKFKHLSARDDRSATLPKSYSKRTQSSDSILEDSLKVGKMSPRSYHSSTGSYNSSESASPGGGSMSKPRAQSMDNLLCVDEASPKSPPPPPAETNHSSGSPEISRPTTTDLLNHLPTSASLDDFGEGARRASLDRNSHGGSQENIMEEELPRPNIVSTTRSVFESISTSPISGGYYKKKTAPSPPTPQANSTVYGAKRDSRQTSEASIGNHDLRAERRMDHPAEEQPSYTSVANDEDAFRNTEIAASQDSESLHNQDPASQKAISEQTLENIKSVGKSWYFSGNGPPPPKETHNNIPLASSSQDKTFVTSDINANKAKPHSETIRDMSSSNSVKSPNSANRSSYLFSDKSSPAPVKTTSYSTSYSTSSSLVRPSYNQNNNINKVSMVESSKTVVDNVSPSKPVAPERRRRVAPKPPSPQATVPSSSVLMKNTSQLDNKPSPPVNHTMTNQTSYLHQDKRSSTSSVNNRDNVITNKENVRSTPTRTSTTSTSSFNNRVDNQQKKPEANRSNLNLNLNDIPPKRTETQVTAANNRINAQKTKNKRKVPEGPGSLLIRPATNLVQGSTPQQYVSSYMSAYNDVKKGEFAPAQKRPSYYDTYSDEEDEEVPVTNIDDMINSRDIPVTNIDDMSPESQREGDATIHVFHPRKRFEFEGAYVKCDRSLLTKTRNSKKMRISFNDSATSTYEYPSEQSLLETLPSQPGDFDYPGQHGMPNGNSTEEDIPDMTEPGSLRSTPGLGSGGTTTNASALGSYRSKFVADYEFGQHREESPPPRPKPVVQEPEEDHLKPSDEDFTFSESADNGILF